MLRKPISWMTTKEKTMIRQIESIIDDSKYNDIIRELIDFISKEFGNVVSIVFVESDNALVQEKIFKRAKIVWLKPDTKFPRTPQSIMIDCKNLKGLNFLFAFLHECGHLKDYNNINIQLRTKRSEVSAWKHAYEDIKSTVDFNHITDIFFNTVKTSLSTYGLHLKNGDELINFDFMTIFD